MIDNQFLLPIAHELVVDLFAGGGGASTGIEQAIGRHVDIAVNHDPQAVSLHEANHPQTKHFVSDVFEVDPLVVTDGQPVGLLWASPDCKHFSKAKGGKPVSKKIRGLAWVVIKWAKLVRPRIICLENVEEFQTWGPLGSDDRPCPLRKGQTYQRWRKQLENLGYVVETRELRACDFGAPTIRKRFFLVARRDGQPIVWPAPTHAAKPVKGSGLLPYRTAADCIDWSIPCPSIFERTKPLAEATQRRIAHGIKRYVLDAAKPFIVPVTHQGDNRVHSIDEPVRTVTTARRGELAFASPTLIQTGYGERPGQAPRVPGLHKPLGTAVDGQKHALVAGYLAKHFGGEPQDGKTCASLERPAPTVTSRDHSSIVTAHVTKFRTGSVGSDLQDPLHTVTAGGQQARPGTGNAMGIVAANLVHLGHGEGADGKARFSHGIRDVEQPLNTVTASGVPAGVVAASLATYYGGDEKAERGQALGAPLATQTTANRHALVTSHLSHFYTSNTRGGEGDVLKPLKTLVTANHAAEVRALLLKYYGTDQAPELGEPMHTVTTKDRFALVTIEGQDYYVADIGMRMLQPRELYRAQGFPESYVIDRGHDGRALPKDAQVRMCGNSVCPPLARAIVAANYSDRQALKAAA